MTQRRHSAEVGPTANLRRFLIGVLTPLLITIASAAIGLFVLGGPRRVFGVFTGDSSVLYALIFLLLVAMTWSMARSLIVPLARSGSEAGEQ